MAKPKFDPNSAFKKILSTTEDPAASENSNNEDGKNTSSKPPLNRSKKKKEEAGIKQMSYYLPEDLIKKLSIASAYSGKTLSLLVQEALENYLDQVIQDSGK